MQPLIVVDELETVSLRGKGKPGGGSSNRPQNPRDLVRLNVTLPNVGTHLDGALLQCTSYDVSLAQKTTLFRLQVFGKI